jgi:hypothetical protein
MGKKAAKAPDYAAAAEKQGQSSIEQTDRQTWANRPDQITPFGRETWTSESVVDPVTGKSQPRWTQRTELTPDAQAALDAQMGVQRGVSEQAGSMLDRIKSEFGDSIDWSQFGAAGGAVAPERIGGGSQYFDKAGDALYNRFASRADPQFAKDEARLDTTLRNRGVKPGDEAYDEELRKLRESQGDQRTQAMFGATIGAGQEASRMFGMDAQASGQNFGQGMQASQYQTQQRQQQIAEEMQRRGFSLNEVNALLYGQQVGMPNMPNFTPSTKADTVNYSGAAQQQYGAAQDAANARNMGIGNLASAITSPFSFAPIKLGG